MMKMRFSASSTGGFEFAADLSGYAVQAELHPKQGLKRGLRVRSLTSRTADKSLPRAEFGASGRLATGTLELVGQSHSRAFADIAARRAWTAVSTREKRRYLEFEYDATMIAASKVTIDNQDDARVEPGGLGDDYKYQLELEKAGQQPERGGTPAGGAGHREAAEHLLGVTVLQSPQHAIVLRLTSLVNSSNSWLQTVLDAHGTIGPGQPMTPIVLRLSQVGDIKISSQNLDHLLVTEHCGVAVDSAALSPADVLAAATTRRAALAWPLPHLGPHELLEHEGAAEFAVDPGDFRAVETATIVFRPGHYSDLCFE